MGRLSQSSQASHSFSCQQRSAVHRFDENFTLCRAASALSFFQFPSQRSGEGVVFDKTAIVSHNVQRDEMNSGSSMAALGFPISKGATSSTNGVGMVLPMLKRACSFEFRTGALVLQWQFNSGVYGKYPPQRAVRAKSNTQRR